jgi:short-subunit dehydrogenase
MKTYDGWAVVTGASSGIGRAFAEHLASIGYDLVLVALEEDALASVARGIRSRSPVQVVTLAGDLADESFRAEVLKATAEIRLGLIVCSAGYGVMGYFIQRPFAEYRAMLAVNDDACLEICHAWLRRWYIDRSRAGLILISSANADANEGVPFSSIYSASKSFLKLVGQALYYEMKPFGIDVLSVSPGPTDTGFQDRAGTKRLFFVESPQSVVTKSLRALGRRSTVTTNPVTRVIVGIHNLVPLESVRFAMRAFFFKRMLGRAETMTLDGLERRSIGEDRAARSQPATRRVRGAPALSAGADGRGSPPR